MSAEVDGVKEREAQISASALNMLANWRDN